MRPDVVALEVGPLEARRAASAWPEAYAEPWFDDQ